MGGPGSFALTPLRFQSSGNRNPLYPGKGVGIVPAVVLRAETADENGGAVLPSDLETVRAGESAVFDDAACGSERDALVEAIRHPPRLGLFPERGFGLVSCNEAVRSRRIVGKSGDGRPGVHAESPTPRSRTA